MTTRAKLKKATFRYIENEIAHYHETVEDLQEWKQLLYEEGGSRWFTHEGSRSNRIIDPTADRAARVIQNRQVRHLEKVTNAIKAVYDGLDDEKKELLRVLYWEKPRRYTWDGIAERFHYSKKTLQRWRNEIVDEVAEKLGMI